MDNNLLVLQLVRRRAAERRRSLRLQRRQLRDASNAFELPELRFVELFRLPPYWVLFLIETLTPFLGQTTRRTGVPVNLRVLAALNFYATGLYLGPGKVVLFNADSNVLVRITEAYALLKFRIIEVALY
ncbi:hypothetical protein CBL_20730 [Carabus blaptoides fortunei]